MPNNKYKLWSFYTILEKESQQYQWLSNICEIIGNLFHLFSFHISEISTMNMYIDFIL